MGCSPSRLLEVAVGPEPARVHARKRPRVGHGRSSTSTVMSLVLVLNYPAANGQYRRVGAFSASARAAFGRYPASTRSRRRARCPFRPDPESVQGTGSTSSRPRRSGFGRSWEPNDVRPRQGADFGGGAPGGMSRSALRRERRGHTVNLVRGAETMEQAKDSRRRNLFGYCDRLTVRPGDTVRFKVSAYDQAAYDAALVRIVNGDAVSGTGDYREVVVDAPFAGRYEGRFQATNIGSHARVEASGPLDDLRSFTVQSFVFPTTPEKGEQHLISRWNETAGRGWALIIDAEGHPAFIAGDGPKRRISIVLSRPLPARRWVLLSASVDAEARSITLAQRSAQDCGFDAVLQPESVTTAIDPALLVQRGPLLFAASRCEPGARGGRNTAHLFNGRLDSMRLTKTALSRTKIEAAARPAPDGDVRREAGRPLGLCAGHRYEPNNGSVGLASSRDDGQPAVACGAGRALGRHLPRLAPEPRALRRRALPRRRFVRLRLAD